MVNDEEINFPGRMGVSWSNYVEFQVWACLNFWDNLPFKNCHHFWVHLYFWDCLLEWTIFIVHRHWQINILATLCCTKMYRSGIFWSSNFWTNFFASSKILNLTVSKLQVCKCASAQVCKWASVQVYKYVTIQTWLFVIVVTGFFRVKTALIWFFLPPCGGVGGAEFALNKNTMMPSQNWYISAF